MDESDEQKKWTKRFNWAVCQEPYKTEIDTIASHWIEGNLTDHELAYEIVRLRSELEWMGRPGEGCDLPPMTDVLSQLEIIADTLMSSDDRPSLNPEIRRECLDEMLAHHRGHDEKQR